MLKLCHHAHELLTTLYAAACLTSVSAEPWLGSLLSQVAAAIRCILLACIPADCKHALMQVAMIVLKQPRHGCKGLENLGNADSAASPKHPIECIATHSLSIIRGTLTILRLAFGLLGTLQSVTVCQHHHCCTFGGWHKWTVVCKLDADKQQLLTDMP